MIIIINVSPRNTPDHIEHEYELRINYKLICKFKHVRTEMGLAQCLQDAADAVNKMREENET